jgi:hypothetical protein
MPWQGGDFPGVATGSAGNSQDDLFISRKKHGLHVSATFKKLWFRRQRIMEGVDQQR